MCSCSHHVATECRVNEIHYLFSCRAGLKSMLSPCGHLYQVREGGEWEREREREREKESHGVAECHHVTTWSVILQYFISGQDFVLRHAHPSDSTRITLLGVEADLTYTVQSDGLHIAIPTSLPYDLLPRNAWTFKMTDTQAKWLFSLVKQTLPSSK